MMPLVKILVFIFIFSFPLLAKRSNIVTANPEYAAGLIRSFNAFCPSQGAWTLSALAESRKIQKVLEFVRDDPKCTEAATSVSVHVDVLGLALDRIRANNWGERDISAKQQQQADISLLLERENDKTQRTYLKTLFRDNQLGLSIERVNLQYNESHDENQDLARVIVDSTSEIFSQVSLNGNCLLRSPQLISSLSSIGAGLGSALATGGMSLGFAATSHILGSTLEFIRKSKLNKSIQKLGQSEFISAYQCVLESLSNQWCEARETLDLIDLKIKSKKLASHNSLREIRILNRELPILVSWLSKVRSGSDGENSIVAAQQTTFLNKQNTLRTWKLGSKGKLGNATDKLPANLDKKDNKDSQFTILKTLVNRINPGNQHSGSYGISSAQEETHPLLEILSANELAWELAGIPFEQVPKEKNTAGVEKRLKFSEVTKDDFEKYPQLSSFYPLFPNKIRESIEHLYDRAAAQLAEQRDKVLYIDPPFLLVDAENDNYAGLPHLRGLSPLKAIDNLLDYFQSIYDTDTPPCMVSVRNAGIKYGNNFAGVYAETEEMLCQIKAQITDTSKDYGERLNEIAHIANMHEGDEFINKRIQGIIQFLIDQTLLDEENEEIDILQYKLLLANDIIKELERYGRSNWTKVKIDIINALQITENTLQNFAEIFSDSLAKTVHQVYEKNNNNPFSEQLLAKYCSLLLSVPDWSSKKLRKIDISLCQSKGLKSEHNKEEGAFEFLFSSDIYHTPFSRDRICHMRRFLRKESFYQNYNEF